MFKTLFNGASLLDIPTLVMLAFFALFVGVIVWTCSKSRNDTYDRMAAMPLHDEENAG